MNIVAELESVLLREQSCLLNGEYTELALLTEKKTQLTNLLATRNQELSKEAIQKLASQAAHNEELLAAARRGIQAAMSQVKDYMSGDHPATYSAEGTREPLSRNVSMIEKYR